jgi:hypothetical protein
MIVTGKSFFDTSSILHLAFWIFMGSCFAYGRVPLWKGLIFMAIGAFGWEVFERFAEHRWPAIWMHPEGALNAWVSDPLMGVLGVLVAYWLVRYQ